MKLFGFLILSLASLSKAEEACTHGKLFISDADSPTVHVFDTSRGILDDLKPEHSVTAPGKAGQNLKATGSYGEIAVMYRGDETIGYTDGTVSFLDSGVRVDGDVTSYVAPEFITNAKFDCARAIHFTPHDNKIGIFCDGTYGDEETGVEQVNSTIWIVDETKFGSATDSAIIFSTELKGSHHGVVIPVDDNHVLYSLATPDRVGRTPEIGVTQALPTTFVIEDYEGKVLHTLDDAADPDKSCAGFHGEWGYGNQFALGCDDNHGGILRVDYNPSTETYDSRALVYPDGFDGHRTGSFAGHDKADMIIANFALQEGTAHLMAFSTDDSQLTEGQILDLPARQCSFAYEKGAADVVLVFMPTGTFHVFEYHDGAWEEMAQTQVVEGMTECGEALFVPGVGQAFVLVKESKTLHAINLEHVAEGELDISTSTLSFTPFDAAISGAPKDAVCTIDMEHGDEHSHSHDHSSHDSHDSGSATLTSSLSAVLAATILAAIKI